MPRQARPGHAEGDGPPARFDVLTIGRVSVDLYPQQVGRRLADVTSFSKTLGGSPTNVAVAAARLGRSSAVITRTGADPFGDYVRGALRDLGVDPRYVGTVDDLLTPVVFCEIHPPDHFPLLFYRLPTAPDMRLTEGDLDLPAVRAAGVLWTTGTGLSEEPSRTATLAALDARSRARHTVHDLDHRPMLWTSPEQARYWQTEAVRRATVVVGNEEEVAVVVGERPAADAAAALLDLGVELAVVKRGPEGVLARTRDELVEVAPMRVDVLNGLGAGDAFGGALCDGLLAGSPVETVLRRANAAGALVASRMACADDMPTAHEIDRLLEAARA